jgi:hypothetical protein
MLMTNQCVQYAFMPSTHKHLSEAKSSIQQSYLNWFTPISASKDGYMLVGLHTARNVKYNRYGCRRDCMIIWSRAI